MGFYDPNSVFWPGEAKRGSVKPVRVGVDRRTGKVLMGRAHVDQSVTVLFGTRFHERVLRRWVGSFVPHVLGENTTARTVGRFYWAIATSLDLFEPGYGLQQVNVSNRDGKPLNSPEEIRAGGLQVRHLSVYRPRGHLNDMTPEDRVVSMLINNNGVWATGETTP